MLDFAPAGRSSWLLRLLRIFSPGRILLVATIVASAYFAFSAGSNLLHSFRLANDEARMRQEVERLRQHQEQLQQIRDYLRTDEYVEFMARRVFGLVKPGERLVVVDAPQPPPAEEPPGLTWWQRLFGN
jgi:cell division protein FtsB